MESALQPIMLKTNKHFNKQVLDIAYAESILRVTIKANRNRVVDTIFIQNIKQITRSHQIKRTYREQTWSACDTHEHTYI